MLLTFFRCAFTSLGLQQLLRLYSLKRLLRKLLSKPVRLSAGLLRLLRCSLPEACNFRIVFSLFCFCRKTTFLASTFRGVLTSPELDLVDDVRKPLRGNVLRVGSSSSNECSFPLTVLHQSSDRFCCILALQLQNEVVGAGFDVGARSYCR
ncbi:hypothetical protein AQ733_17820 [Burkholderia pseudomallei]|nr:hypothetical protein AQ733_17820 [Burkholderia pseudomallei]OMS16422.1 hypothetical protein AQ735_27405 [Burkholderia pseudomallei]